MKAGCLRLSHSDQPPVKKCNCHAQEITLFFKQIIQSGERVLIRMDELLDTDGSFIQELKRLKRNLSNPDTLRWYKRER